jgi:hypothetical protein
MRVAEAWAVLGLEPTDDTRATKRAYSGLLKQIDVDRDPKGFIRLREALELALQYGSVIPAWDSDDYDDSAEWQDEEALAADEALASGVEAEEQAFEPYETAGAWQPAAPPEGQGGLAEASQRLSRLLFDPEPVEPAEIEAAGEALLAEVDKAAVDEAAGTERWLLGALVDSIPRSDPLIGPAMDHFGWDNAVRPRDYGFGYDLDTLHQRRADQAELSRIVSFSVKADGPFIEKIDTERDQRAIEELRRPGRTRVSPFELSLPGDVRRFLKETLATHPMMEHDLDPGQLAFWRAYFQGRHLPDHFWIILFGTPPVIVLVGFLSVKLGGADAPISLLTAFGLAYAATLIGIAASIEIRARASARDRAIYDHGYRSGPAKAWLAVSLAMPPLAGLMRFDLIAGVGWSAVALAAAIGTILATRVPTKEESESTLGPRGVSGSTLLACAAVCYALIPPGPAHLLGPLLALCYVGYRGHDAAAIIMREISAGKARLIIAGAGLLVAAAMAPLFLFAPGFPPPALLMLVPVALAAQHLATAHQYLSTGGLEWGARAVGILFYVIAARTLFEGRDAALVVAIMVYVLLYALARTTVAFRQEMRGPEKPPAYF